MANWKFYLDNIEVEEPIGWDAIEFTALRMESHGIDQPFSTEMKFYQKGAKYIKGIYDQYFINQPIAIKILSDVGYNGVPYQFDGFLNLAIYEEQNVCDTDSWEITVGIIDDNFREDFKSRQDVTIDLITNKDLNNNIISDITYNNIRLHKQDVFLIAKASAFRLLDSWQWNWIDGWSRDQFNNSRFASVMPLYWQSSDFKEAYSGTFDPTQLAFTYSNAFFKNNSNYTRTLKFTSTIDEVGLAVTGQSLTGYNLDGNSVNLNITIYIVKSPFSAFADVTNQYILYDSPNLALSGTSTSGIVDYNVNLSQQIVVPAGQIAICSVQWGINGTFIPYTNYFVAPEFWQELTCDPLLLGVCATLTEINSGDYASFCDTLKIEDAFNRIIYKITGSNNKLLSNAFSQSGNGCYWNNVITNGLKIRNAPTIEQIEESCSAEQSATNFPISFKQLFDGLDKIFCLGWAFEWTGSEWKIRIEPREYFYQNIISQTFENVGEVKQTAKIDKLFNQISLGYSEKWKNIQTSGAWAIHTNRNYFIKNRAMNEASSAKLEILSDVIAEGYAIEFSRRMQFYTTSSGSSDRPNDYELFIIWINRNELTINPVQLSEYAIDGEDGSITFSPGTVSVSSDRILTSNSPLTGLYNIYHTPARVALRWWKVLGTNTYGLADPKLQFQVGQYQTQYSSAIEQSTEPCIQPESGYLLEENTDIYSDLLQTEYQYYLLKPIGIEFSYPQSLCDFLTLSQDEQYKKVRLTSGSLDIQGFITEATNQPEDASGGTTKFTLLMSAQDALAGGAFDAGFDDGYEN